MAKLNFQQYLLQALESHDPLEIIWYANFVFRDILLLLPSFEQFMLLWVYNNTQMFLYKCSFIHSSIYSCCLSVFVEEVKKLFSRDFSKFLFPFFIRTAFIEI